jgi:hypothetical protein
MNALLNSRVESVAIMRLEERIDDLRERLDDATDGAFPNECEIRQHLAEAEQELGRLKSPFTESPQL